MPESPNPRKRILLVDDDETHLTATELILRNEYDIFMEKSGKGALEFLDKSRFIPDLILLDIIMLEMDGWEVFTKIREIARFKDVPIEFLTSVDEDGGTKKSIVIGSR